MQAMRIKYKMVKIPRSNHKECETSGLDRANEGNQQTKVIPIKILS